MRLFDKVMRFFLSVLYFISIIILNLLLTAIVIFVVVLGLNYSLGLELDFRKVLVFYLCFMLIYWHFKENVFKSSL
jgi:hypothetical protein